MGPGNQMRERKDGQDEALSPEFREFLADEELASRARAMVDAILEEDPTTDPEKALADAIHLLKEHPAELNNIDSPNQSSDDKIKSDG